MDENGGNECGLEMFCKEDSAWYDGTLWWQNKKITVHFNDFSAEDDEWFDPKILHNPEELKLRVRRTSVQLQDSQCNTVYQDQQVCGCFVEGDIRKYYDAEVREVVKKQHQYVRDGDQVCTCIFKLYWRAGPKKGEVTEVGCGEVCFLSTDKLDDHPLIKGLLQNGEKLKGHREVDSPHDKRNSLSFMPTPKRKPGRPPKKKTMMTERLLKSKSPQGRTLTKKNVSPEVEPTGAHSESEVMEDGLISKKRPMQWEVGPPNNTDKDDSLNGRLFQHGRKKKTVQWDGEDIIASSVQNERPPERDSMAKNSSDEDESTTPQDVSKGERPRKLLIKRPTDKNASITFIPEGDGNEDSMGVKKKKKLHLKGAPTAIRKETSTTVGQVGGSSRKDVAKKRGKIIKTLPKEIELANDDVDSEDVFSEQVIGHSRKKKRSPIEDDSTADDEPIVKCLERQVPLKKKRSLREEEVFEIVRVDDVQVAGANKHGVLCEDEALDLGTKTGKGDEIVPIQNDVQTKVAHDPTELVGDWSSEQGAEQQRPVQEGTLISHVIEDNRQVEHTSEGSMTKEVDPVECEQPPKDGKDVNTDLNVDIIKDVVEDIMGKETSVSGEAQAKDDHVCEAQAKDDHICESQAKDDHVCEAQAKDDHVCEAQAKDDHVCEAQAQDDHVCKAQAQDDHVCEAQAKDDHVFEVQSNLAHVEHVVTQSNVKDSNYALHNNGPNTSTHQDATVGEKHHNYSQYKCAQSIANIKNSATHVSNNVHNDASLDGNIVPEVAPMKPNELSVLLKEEKVTIPKNSRTLLIENMERDVSASDAMEQLAKLTEGICAIHVMPAREYEASVTGYALYRDTKSAQKALRCINSCGLIVSKNGRPWVMSMATEEHNLRLFGFAMHSAIQSYGTGFCGIISDQPSGQGLHFLTREDEDIYNQASRMKDLFEEHKLLQKELYHHIIEDEKLARTLISQVPLP